MTLHKPSWLISVEIDRQNMPKKHQTKQTVCTWSHFIPNPSMRSATCSHERAAAPTFRKRSRCGAMPPKGRLAQPGAINLICAATRSRSATRTTTTAKISRSAIGSLRSNRNGRIWKEKAKCDFKNGNFLPSGFTCTKNSLTSKITMKKSEF